MKLGCPTSRGFCEKWEVPLANEGGRMVRPAHFQECLVLSVPLHDTDDVDLNHAETSLRFKYVLAAS